VSFRRPRAPALPSPRAVHSPARISTHASRKAADETGGMMWQWGRRWAEVLSVVVAAIGAGGCAAPDRSAQAERIRTAIQAMPGVDFVDPGYINDFENGATLKIQVGVSGATEQQIADVADRVRVLKGTDFSGYRQEHPSSSTMARSSSVAMKSIQTKSPGTLWC
jgi:hypothetical protein